MKVASAIILAAGLALAGCFESPPDEEVGTASADGGSASASASSVPEGSAAVRTAVPFSAEGSTFNAVFGCAAVTCQGAGLPGMGEGASSFEPDIAGMLQEADLTLTWSAQTPATTELLLGIQYQADGETSWIFARGPSPLTLAQGTLGIPAADVDAIYVNAYTCNGGASALVCTSAEQAFTIEGTLTTTSA